MIEFLSGPMVTRTIKSPCMMVREIDGRMTLSLVGSQEPVESPSEERAARLSRWLKRNTKPGTVIRVEWSVMSHEETVVIDGIPSATTWRIDVTSQVVIRTNGVRVFELDCDADEYELVQHLLPVEQNDQYEVALRRAGLLTEIL